MMDARCSIAIPPGFGKGKIRPACVSGADDPIRTDDLGITSAPLYQLSYVGSYLVMLMRV